MNKIKVIVALLIICLIICGVWVYSTMISFPVTTTSIDIRDVQSSDSEISFMINLLSSGHFISGMKHQVRDGHILVISLRGSILRFMAKDLTDKIITLPEGGIDTIVIKCRSEERVLWAAEQTENG